MTEQSAKTARINGQWARTLIGALASSGVRRAVVSPGSRSTPLTLACLEHPGMEVWVQVDERSAAFFALGLARAQGAPVALIATSGSAPAHWHPAVIEASHSRLPLLLLSADRPPELQACGANQTTDQTHLFGGQVRAFHAVATPEETPEALGALAALAAKAIHEALWPVPGPVHLNLPFREPLVPPPGDDFPLVTNIATAIPPILQPSPDQIARLAGRLSGRRGLIVCGDSSYRPAFAPAVAELASRLGSPLLADPLSGLRFGAHLNELVMTRYDAFLRREALHQSKPEWVLRFGALPVSKTLAGYLASAWAETIVVDPFGGWPDPLHQAAEMVRGDPERVCETLLAQELQSANGWAAGFIEAEAEAERIAAAAEGPLEAAVIRSLIQQLPEHATLFCGNSMPIRDVDSFSGSGRKALRIVANRGVSGIDGNISTLLGLAAADRSKRAVGLIGDLALYHDMNGLLAARGLNPILVVINNGGGGIFGYLPQAGLAHFEQGWLTPTGLDLQQVARLYGLQFARVETAAAFEAAFCHAFDQSGPALIEVIIDRQESVARHRRYWQQAAGL